MAPPQPHLRVLVFQDLPGVWTARGLEHDITTEGRTIDAAIRAVLEIVSAHVAYDRRHNRPPLSAFPAAPQRYWTSFAWAVPVHRVQREVAAQLAADRIHVEISIARERPSVHATGRITPNLHPGGYDVDSTVARGSGPTSRRRLQRYDTTPRR